MVEIALAKTEEVGSPRVVGMHFVVNAGGHVSEESVRLCFDVAAQGTPAEGAALFFVWLPRYQCFHCGNIFEGHTRTTAQSRVSSAASWRHGFPG